MMAAANEVMPDTSLFGCYFHLRQAVERQIQMKGIKTRVNQNADLRFAINCFYALCFVPIGFCADVVKNYISPLYSKTLPLEPLVQNFFLYICSTYLSEFNIGRKKRNPVTFKAEVWNCVANLMNNIPITNNGAESFNSAYNLQSLARQNIYLTIKGT